MPKQKPTVSADETLVELRKGGWAVLDNDPDGVTAIEMMEMQTRIREHLEAQNYAEAFTVPMKFVKAWSYPLDTDDPVNFGKIHARDYIIIMEAVGALVDSFLHGTT
jgi:hypothetical protein